VVPAVPGGPFIDFPATGSAVLSNAIFANGGPGIDLGGDGVTANDDDDPDEGANDLQNYPVVTSAVNLGEATSIAGTLNSTPNTTFTVRVFMNISCDASGFGEGRAPVTNGTFTVTTDETGNASFLRSVEAIPVEWVVTATATDPAGNTSEFSACRPVVPGF
jgi:hypothetical protein